MIAYILKLSVAIEVQGLCFEVLSRCSVCSCAAGIETMAVNDLTGVNRAVVGHISAEFIALEKSDPLLLENPRRFVLFPIQYPGIHKLYKRHLATFWTAEQIDLAQDGRDWDTLAGKEQHFVKHILAFFAASDDMVLENLASRFCSEIQIPEARCFYGFQIAMKNIHGEIYGLLIERYIKDPTEKDKIFDTIHTMTAVEERTQWAVRWMNNSCSFAERALAFACVEGILLSGSFCAIHWLKKRGLMPGLTLANELILRDERLHCEFACLLYGMLKHQLPEDVVHSIVRGAVSAEKRLMCESLLCDLIGVSSNLMARYIEFVADRLLTALGHSMLCGASSPFDWMEQPCELEKAQFLEKRGTAGQKAGDMASGHGKETMDFSLDTDF